MFFTEMWKALQRHARTVKARQARRGTQLRRPLFLEALEDRTLLTAWTAIGPAPITNGQTAGALPVSGRVTGIAADPNDANTIYIAAAGGGIWKTTNGGTSWTPLTDNLSDGSGNPIPEFMGAVAETDDSNGNQIVYGGTGEANNSGDSGYGEGILVSKDGGASWTLTTAGGAFGGEEVSKIVIDPSDTTGATAYAAVAGGGNTGIWKTTDFGATWTNTTATNGLSTSNEWSDVVLDPHTPSTLYAADGTLSGAAGNGVYKSTDGGTTWSLLNGTGTFNGTQDGRIALALYDDGTTNELFVSIAVPTSNSSTGGDLFKMLESTNGGSSFTDLTANLSNYLGGQGWYDTTLGIDPKNPSIIYAGGAQGSQGPTFSGSPLISYNAGSTWTDIATDPAGKGPHTDDHGIAFDKNGNLIDGNDGGVFKLTVDTTTEANDRWSSLNTNLQITQFYSIAVDPTNGNVWGGSQDNGTEKYTGGPGWTAVPPDQGDGGITRVDPTNHNIIYQEYVGVSPRVSTNGGTSFSSIASGIKSNTSNGHPIVNFIAPYVLDSSGNIYYGSDYLNFSSNHGSNWSQIGTPGTNGFNPNDKAIDAIAVSPTNNNVVYVSAGGKLFVTQNAQAGGNNVTWTQINLPGVRAGGLNSLAVDPTVANGGTAYAVVNSFQSGGKHVFQTTNFGSTWTDISGNLLNTPVDSVAVSSDGKTVYIGTDVGVYSTSNINGSLTSWAKFGAGLPNAQVDELDLVPSLNLLAVGTHGRGAWEITTAATVTNVTSSTANGTYGIGATISIQVTFSEAVTVTGTPILTLNSGGTASYTSGSGTNTLTFTYNVANGNTTNGGRLDYTSIGALTLNGGAIKDANGNAAYLTLASPGFAGSLSANKDIVIDAIAPTVLHYYVLFGSQKYDLIGSTRFDLPWKITGIQVVFSRPIDSGDLDSLTGLTATSLSGLGTTTLTWTINPVTNGSFATALLGSGPDALKDAVGNPLYAGAGFNENFKVLEGDVNGDGIVNPADLNAVLQAQHHYNIFADINGDGSITGDDIVLVLSLMGRRLS